jgi:hypothetical protein
MSFNWSKFAKTSLIACYLLSIWFILFFTKQDTFFQFIPAYSLCFASYLLLFFKLKLDNILSAVLLIASCIIVLFSFPNLSDDVYRYYWDGVLLTNGISPFAYLPSEVLNMNIEGLDKPIFNSLNSQEYYSIYPFTSQFLFGLSAYIGNDIYQFAFIMKLSYIAFATLGIWYGVKFCKSVNIDINLPFVFYLNPLVIIEGFGNLHTELISCSLLLLFIYYFHKSRLYQSLLTAALAISTKLNPAFIFLFFLFKKEQFKRFLLPLGLISAILILPVFLGVSFTNFLSSVDLYFRKFEFNASVYYLLRYIGFNLTGYNLIAYIGPILGISFLYILIQRAYHLRQDLSIMSFLQYGFYIYFIYLLL